MKATLLCTLLLTSLVYICIPAFAQAQSPEIPVTDTTPVYHEPRSIPGGLFIAGVFPGVFIHGSGNYYAGSHTSGMVLTATELAGVALIFAGFIAGVDFNGNEDDDGEPLLVAGVCLYFGSWAADIISTPFLVNKYNNRIKNRGMELGLAVGTQPRDGQMTVGVAVRF